jgi:mannose-6-phosphate isomerase-like protein (cupin superfamily)
VDSVRPPFPGAVGVTHLEVYEAGGTPHVHLACTEAYAVAAGRGAVQTLTCDGFTETPLEAGTFVWFTPGTIHRLVNDGDLEIFVVMQNAGLPEAGDMVITFPPEHLTDPMTYERARSLDPDGARRELGLAGFEVLKDDPAALTSFYEAAGALVRNDLPRWRQVWQDGPVAAAEATGRQLDALASGDVSHLREAGVHSMGRSDAENRLGCCGALGVFLP